jgi:hypothetical protein
MIEYTHIKNLLQDNQYFADLLNGPCKPISLDNGGDKGNYGPDGKYIPINPGWIDEERSSRMTDIYHNLIPIEMPYMTMVRVVRNPDVQMDGVSVDENDKRTRYIVVTIVPDLSFPYNTNFPLIQGNGIISLCTWEMTRATIAASEAYIKVAITDEPHPPILNNAVIEWVSFYIGDKGFSGPTNLNQMAIYATDINLDTHLYNVHTLKEDPLVNRIKEAANLDSIQV